MNICKECGVSTENAVFCSAKCSCRWNNKNSMSTETRKKQGKKNSEGVKRPENILDVSSRTSRKILKRLNIGCSICGWNEALCDIHHIVPKREGGTNDNSNLTYICPNCHRLAHSGKLHNFISLNEQIGELWRSEYYAHE